MYADTSDMSRNSFPAGENVIFVGRHHRKGMQAAIITIGSKRNSSRMRLVCLVCDGMVLVGRVLHVREESVR